ncbi:MAG: diaminobutyrate--2-oxoglutarate transaminase [Planctomycetota bacterium]
MSDSNGLNRIAKSESNVRGYVRLFPTVFDRAKGSELWDTEGKRYIDFFCGAGTLNYGHNNEHAKAALMDYIGRDGIQHALDTATAAKVDFLDTFQSVILGPRDLNYRIQFTGPTGTNAVEAAVKLAKLATERSHVIAFTHAYHGHSLGALALTGNSYYHSEFFDSRNNVSHFPFDGYCEGLNSADLLDQMLADPSSGIPKPAAIILETVQGEGGVNVASAEWLQSMATVCRKHGSLLIVDDIQVGNGRTGKFFSFEEMGIQPDLVCMSKSIGGGLPMSIVLVNPSSDVWQPGQHTGTFRGNNLAFVASRALLEYWRDDELELHARGLSTFVEAKLNQLVARFAGLGFQTRGRGLIQGLDVRRGDLARAIIDRCFESGLLIEASGADDEVLKVMPALTTEPDLLREGMDILTACVENAIEETGAEELPDASTAAADITSFDLAGFTDAELGNVPGASL